MVITFSAVARLADNKSPKNVAAIDRKDIQIKDKKGVLYAKILSPKL